MINIPKHIIDESNRLDDTIRYSLISKYTSYIAFVVYIIGALFVEKGLPYIIIWLSVVIIISMPGIILKRKVKLTEREFISFSLCKISEGIDSGDVKNKYLKILNKSISYLEKTNIEKEDKVFKDFKIKENMFFKNILDLSLKINHAKNNGFLNKFSSNEIGELGRMVYYNSGDFLILSNKISKAYKETERLPGFMDYLKLMIKNKCLLFLVLESLVIFVLWIIYKFIYNEMGSILSGFFILTAAVVGFIATRKY